MICSKCGNKLPDNAKFCSKCGSSVAENSSQSYGNYATIQKSDGESTRRTEVKKYIEEAKKVGITIWDKIKQTAVAYANIWKSVRTMERQKQVFWIGSHGIILLFLLTVVVFAGKSLQSQTQPMYGPVEALEDGKHVRHAIGYGRTESGEIITLVEADYDQEGRITHIEIKNGYDCVEDIPDLLGKGLPKFPNESGTVDWKNPEQCWMTYSVLMASSGTTNYSYGEEGIIYANDTLYTYDSKGMVTKANGYVYTYNELGQLTTVYWSDDTYEEKHITKIDYKNDLATKVESTDYPSGNRRWMIELAYNESNQVTEIKAYYPIAFWGTVIDEQVELREMANYTYKDGKLAEISYISGNEDKCWTLEYVYDEDGKLIQSRQYDYQKMLTEECLYNDVGNLAEKTTYIIMGGTSYVEYQWQWNYSSTGYTVIREKNIYESNENQTVVNLIRQEQLMDQRALAITSWEMNYYSDSEIEQYRHDQEFRQVN